MKKFIKIVLILAGVFTPMHAFVTSHTFFSVIPEFQKASPVRESLFRNDLLDQCCNGCGGAFEAVFYGGRTTKDEGSEKLIKFFLPPNTIPCCLNFREYNDGFERSITNAGLSADYDNLKNIEARHFNIVTNNGADGSAETGSFASRVCFLAEQSKFGVGFVYKHRLTCKCDGSTGFWFEGSLPVERIRNRFVFFERVEDNGNGPLLSQDGLDLSPHVANVEEAFRQPNWRFGKIDCRCQRERWGVADIELYIGYNTHSGACCTLNSFLGFVAPTGNRVKGKYLFETIIGNNRHWGIIFGNSVAFKLWRKWGWDIDWYLDLNARYLLDNEQVRSFDLVGKPWSRYMEVYSSPEQAFSASQNDEQFSGTSGINVFTRCVKVKPHFQFRLNQAILFQKYWDCISWLTELGFNFFARQKETVEFTNCDPITGIALKDVAGLGRTTTARTIKSNYFNPNADLPVNTGVPFTSRYLELSALDVDLESAAHPAVLSYIAYGTIGFKGERDCPYFGGIGASIEFQQEEVNTALERWTVWAKLGLTF